MNCNGLQKKKEATGLARLKVSLGLVEKIPLKNNVVSIDNNFLFG